VGVSRETAAENRKKIVAAAERLFRRKGVDAVGLTELMNEAGFTQGGFYNHFDSKEALVEEVLDCTVGNGVEQLAAAIAGSQADGLDPLERQIKWYLSSEQRDDIDGGCSIAAFAGDVRRMTKEAQLSYAVALASTLDHLAYTIQIRLPKLSKRSARVRAIALYSGMVGALLMSRAVAKADPKLAADILEHTRADLLNDLRPHRRTSKSVSSIVAPHSQSARSCVNNVPTVPSIA
jgi:TetR/AcrR family transcriptional repressor of nem operon